MTTKSDVVFIYGLVDPRSGAIRYVGKANDMRKRLASHMRDRLRRKTPLYDWINMLVSEGMSPSIIVISRTNQEKWIEQERNVIKYFRSHGVKLLNVADGGDQPDCPKHVRASNGRKNAQNRDPRKWRLMLKLGKGLKSGYVSSETKQKMRSRMDLFGRFSEYLV